MQLASQFEPIGARFEMTWGIHDSAERPTILILVSQLGHCLNDLLYRHRIGALRANTRRSFQIMRPSSDLPDQLVSNSIICP